MTSVPRMAVSDNAFIADKLDEVAGLLDQQGASPFRVRAYRDAADYVRTTTQRLNELYTHAGRSGLENLPTIGASIASAIIELLETGDLALLDRLRGSTDPEKLFQTVPMIGPSLARSIHDSLHIDTLEALESAAHDGRLATVKGIGRRRIDGIRFSLNDLLARRRPRPLAATGEAPGIADILSVDTQYRGSLRTLPVIRPRRFNDNGHARIPILHCERDHWRFTAIFSNTAAAHRYGRTRDWVVIYFEQDDAPEGLATVVTQHGGPMDGMRVVRGREQECAAHYDTTLDGINA
ncbi:helix-hairpin-helix domain-containing protein [uncultured Tateyamaria sp.]|uniref:helix-hairpin-helix domain-containing protein n=1 Tax=uncultured Tateyamaria sp. TaxID=455651 RepID=UPI00261D39BC|nr:helix-hairpin-helix domain-containing protein [uncultured Tateyamaria sp.]